MPNISGTLTGLCYLQCNAVPLVSPEDHIPVSLPGQAAILECHRSLLMMTHCEHKQMKQIPKDVRIICPEKMHDFSHLAMSLASMATL